MIDRRRAGIWVAALTAAGFAIRAAALGAEPLWLDEAWSVDFARRALFDTVFAEISHPPLFRTLLHLWIGIFGDSDVLARIPSLLFATASIPLVFAVGRRLVPRAALLATALFALSPYEVWFAREARNYALLVLLALLSVLMLLRHLERPRPRSGVAFGLATLLGLLTHYFFVFVVAAEKLHALSRGRRALAAWALPAGAAGVLFLPWALYVVANWEPQTRAWMEPPTRAVGDAFSRMAGGYGLRVIHAGDSPRGRGDAPENSWPAHVVPPLLLLAAVLLGLRGIVRDGAGPLVLSILLLPPAVLVAIHAMGGPGLASDRTLIFASPFLYLAAARGIVSLRRTGFRAGLAAAILLVFATSQLSTDLDPRVGKEEWDAVGAWLESRAGPKDVVLVHKPYLEVAVRRYYHGEATVIPLGAPGPVPLAGFLQAPGSWNARRVFLVLGHTGWDTGDEWVTLLRKAFTLKEERLFPKSWGVRGYEFVP